MRHGNFNALAWLVAAGLVLNLAVLCPACPGLAFGVTGCGDGSAGCGPTVCATNVAVCDVAAVSCCGGPSSACVPPVEAPASPTDDDPCDPVPLPCLLLCLQFCVNDDETTVGDLPVAVDSLQLAETVVADAVTVPSPRPRPDAHGPPPRGPTRPVLCIWRN